MNFRFEDSPEGEFIETVMAAQGELERKQNRRQVIQKMGVRVNAGYYLFGPPIGYRYDKVDGHGKMLVRDEPVATTIEDALNRFANGQLSNFAELHRFLNACPHVKGKGKTGEIKFDTAKAILHRPLYAGYITVDGWDVHLMKGHHEPLISFETYQRIQDRLDGRPVAPVRKDTNALFPLRGFIACATCGSPMTGSLSKGRSRHDPFYFCRQSGCSQRRKNIRGEKLESDFEGFLRKLRPYPELIKLLTRMINDLWQDRLAQRKDERKAAKGELAKLTQEIDRTAERAVNADSAALQSSYESRIKSLDAQCITLTEKMTTHAAPKDTLATTIRTAVEFLLNPWKLWASERIEDRNLTLRLMFAAPLAYCPKQGVRTANLTLPFKVLAGICKGNSEMVEHMRVT